MKGIKAPKIDLKGLGKTLDIIGKFGKEHLPEILTILGLLGATGSIISVAKAVKDSEDTINQAEAEIAEANDGEYIEMPRKEKFKLCWKKFIPGTILYISSVGLIIAGQKVSLARLAAITGLLKLKSKDLEDLKNKIIEKDGEKQLKSYEQAVEQDNITACPPSNIYNTGHGNTIFYDPMTGTYFLSDIWHVQRAIIHMIEAVRNENYYELHDFYDDLDLPKNECGQFFAFTYALNKDLKYEHPETMFGYTAVNPDDGDTRPCIYLKYLDRISASYTFEHDVMNKQPW